jgi:voltage-gated potassium channel
MTGTAVVRAHGNAYEIFILVLTVMSLAVMALGLLPLSQPTLDALRFFDNLMCFIFLADFAYNLSGSRPRSEYFIHRRGWLDLLGSIPSLGILPFSGLFRLARLSRLARILRLLRGQNRRELVHDIVQNRGQYALFVTLMLVMLVLTTSSVLIVQFESQDPDANIATGGDALWWAFVTITTVGYGDRYPVTMLGRATAVAVMFAGIGVIGALASILASILVPGPNQAVPDDETSDVASDGAAPTDPVSLAATLAGMQSELEAIRTELAALRASPAGTGPGPAAAGVEPEVSPR